MDLSGDDSSGGGGDHSLQVGLQGEELDLPSENSKQWNSQATFPKNQPLTWYKTNFDAPAGSNPIALDFTGMREGEAWVNGQSIGRYWPTYIAPNSGFTDTCNYTGPYKVEKCRKKCGKPSQELYHVPRSWLKPTSNTLVLLEEIGGDKHMSQRLIPHLQIHGVPIPNQKADQVLWYHSSARVPIRSYRQSSLQVSEHQASLVGALAMANTAALECPLCHRRL